MTREARGDGISITSAGGQIVITNTGGGGGDPDPELVLDYGSFADPLNPLA